MLNGPTWVVKSRDRYYGDRSYGGREWVVTQGLATRFEERNSAADVARRSDHVDGVRVVRLVGKRPK